MALVFIKNTIGRPACSNGRGPIVTSFNARASSTRGRVLQLIVTNCKCLKLTFQTVQFVPILLLCIQSNQHNIKLDTVSMLGIDVLVCSCFSRWTLFGGLKNRCRVFRGLKSSESAKCF